MEISSLVICWNPALFCMMAGILCKKYLGRRNNLLSLLKSLIHLTCPSFFGIKNVGKAHSLVKILLSTFFSIRWLSSFWNTSWCTNGMGYGVQKTGGVDASLSWIEIFLWTYLPKVPVKRREKLEKSCRSCDLWLSVRWSHWSTTSVGENFSYSACRIVALVFA